MSITLQGIDFEITGAINSRTAANIDRVTNSLKNLRSTMAGAKLGSGYRDLGALGGTSSDGERVSGSGSGTGSTTTSAGRMTSLIGSLRGMRTEFKGAGQAANEFYSSLKRIAMYRAFRTIVKEIASGIKEGAMNMYQWSKAGGDLGAFAATLDSIATSFLYLKNSVGAAVAPILNVLAPALDFIVDKLVTVLNLINQVLSILSGAGGWTRALKHPTEMAKAAGSATGKLKELKKTILGFDEINKLNDQNKNTGGGGVSGLDYSKMFEPAEFEGKMAKIKALIEQHMIEVEAILSAFEFALGAILLLSGHPIIGLALMAHGAYKLFNINSQVDWNTVPTQVANVLTAIEGVVGGFALALGTFLLLTGNIPLGIAMVAVGAGMIWQAASINWQAASADLTTALSTVTGIVLGALLGIGVILMFTGVATGLGLACIVAGLAGIVATVAVNWNSASTEVGKQMQTIMYVAGLSLMGIGLLLMLTGHYVLGIGAMIAGVGTLFAASTVDWDSAKDKVTDTLQSIGLAVGGALFVIGLLFFLTGHFFLGIGAMGAGASLYITAGSVNWDAVPEKVEKAFEKIKQMCKDFKSWIEDNWDELNRWFKALVLGPFKIQMPDFKVSGGFGWNGSGFDFPTITVDWKWFAKGGFPDKGDLFVANENGAGAEMVGSLNGRTTVANNQQIVEGIRQGVKDANGDEVKLLREQNDLLRAILEKEGVVEVPLSTITNAMARKNQRDGGTFVPVG